MGISVVYGLLVGASGATFVGVIILGGALLCGYTFAMINVIRNKSLAFDNLFEGFRKPSFSATIGLNVKTAIFTLLWMLLFYFPAFIAVYRYSMAPFILMDHPEMTGGEAITASKELMKGKKWKLFCVELSFIGWVSLSFLTFGILLLWIEPWMMATMAAFYESIKDEVPSQAIETATAE